VQSTAGEPKEVFAELKRHRYRETVETTNVAGATITQFAAGKAPRHGRECSLF
jgi:hypothetical protein